MTKFVSGSDFKLDIDLWERLNDDGVEADGMVRANIDRGKGIEI
jgi:hypothetical protein